MSGDETSLTVDQARASLQRVMEGGRVGVSAGQTGDGSWSIRICEARFKETPDLTSMPLLSLVLDRCVFDTLRLDRLRARRVEVRGCEGGFVSGVGLVIDGGTGDLTFEDVKLRGGIDLSRARIGGRLTCRTLSLLGDGDRADLNCSRINVGDDVDLIGDCYVKGEVSFVSAEIGGTFTYTGQVDRGDGVALRCNGMHVKGAFRIGDPDNRSDLRPTEVRGEVRLVEANVEGDVNFTRTQVVNPGGIAIDAEHATVGEDLYLDRGFVAHGTVRLVGARVTQLLNCTGGTFHGVRGSAIDADGLAAAGVRFDREREGRRFSAEGAIRLSGAKISREILCSGGRFVPGVGDEDPVAIWAENMVCDTVYLDEDCQVSRGSIRLGGARIAGGVYCVRGNFHAANGNPVIQADGAEFGSLFLQATFVGEVSLRGARVKRELNCSGGAFHNPEGRALAADRLTCGHLYLNRHFVAHGIVSLWEATIEFVDCDKATVDGRTSVERTPRLGEYETAALDLAGVEVRQHVLARHVKVKGGLKLAGAHVRGDLDLTGATVIPANADRADKVPDPSDGGQRTTVDARQLAVDGTLTSWRLPWRPAGRVDMSNSRIGLLRADMTSWPSLGPGRPAGPVPGALNLNGLRYNSLETTGTAPVQQRLAWLAWSRPFSQQPYEELARTYLERGQVSDARRVRLQEQRERTRRAKLPPLSKAWNLFLEWTVGYGYRPGRILVILVTFAVAGGLLFHVAQHNGIMEAVSYHPDKCLERLAVPAPSGEGRQREIPVEVEFRGGTPKAVVSIDKAQASRTDIDAIRNKLPEEYKSLGPALNFQESAQLPPCRVQANRCTSFYPCFYPAAYSAELLIPVVNLRQLTYWLPDQSANSDGPWYLHGVWYLTFAWTSIILGWVSVTALAAGISRAWRSD